MSRVNPAAAIGFDREAASYASVRPSYPDAVVQLLAEAGVAPGGRVCDLAAGTGIFTRQLIGAGYDVVAVEPVAGMRAQLTASTPGIDALDGTAELLPLADGSIDAITVAQGFHWFDPQPALVEIARVLRPGGVLLMCWNVRDESVRWVQGWTDTVHGMSGGRPYSDHRERDWVDVIDECGPYGDVSYRRFANSFETSRAAVIERTRSTSFVAAAEPALRDAILEAVGQLIDGDPDTAGRDVFEFPNHCDVWWCHRLP